MEVSGQLHTPVALTLERKPLYPLDKRLCGPQSWSGYYGGEKDLIPAGNQTLAIQPIACHCTGWTGLFAAY
jgi:hypothetical protein